MSGLNNQPWCLHEKQRLALEVDILGMPIEIIPKVKTKKLSLSQIVLIVVLVLMAICAAAYFYLGYASDKAASETGKIQKSITDLENENRELENTLLAYEGKINSFKTFIGKHEKTENIFAFIEKKCHPQVSFSLFEFNNQKVEISISGKAKSLVALEQQTLIFKAENFVKNVNLSQVSLGSDGAVSFSFILALDPQIFQ